jgi:ketosteroid isomerase-like protein
LPRSPVEIVRAAYETWNRDDFEAATELMHPDVEWRTSGAFPGFEPVYHGYDGVRAWWRDLKEPFESFTIEVDRVEEHGDVLVSTVRFRAIGKESGVQVDLPFAGAWWIEDGLVKRYASYRSLEEARAAVDG